MGKKYSLLIAKSKFSHAFKNSNYQEIDVLYSSNNNSWSTSEIFSEYNDILNFKLKESNRKFKYFIQHFRSQNFKKRKYGIFIFPTQLQIHNSAIGYGVIKSFKSKYKSFLNNYLIVMHLEANDDNVPCSKINMLDVLVWVERSNAMLTLENIINCWKKVEYWKLLKIQ